MSKNWHYLPNDPPEEKIFKIVLYRTSNESKHCATETTMFQHNRWWLENSRPLGAEVVAWCDFPSFYNPEQL